MTAVFGGRLVSWTDQFVVPPPVGVPELSRGTFIVTVADPRPPDSALVIGGTSLAADNCAENTIGPLFDGPVGLSLSPPQRAAPSAAATITAAIVNRLMRSLLPGECQNFRVMLKPR